MITVSPSKSKPKIKSIFWSSFNAVTKLRLKPLDLLIAAATKGADRVYLYRIGFGMASQITVQP
jgi:hypothetical protein